jgi:hypothetical protein
MFNFLKGNFSIFKIFPDYHYTPPMGGFKEEAGKRLHISSLNFGKVLVRFHRKKACFVAGSFNFRGY